MPRKRIFKKKRPFRKPRRWVKRGFNKGKRDYASTVMLREPHMPDKLIVKMRYHETDFMDPGLGAVGHLLYRANGAFDPRHAVGGHQPMSWNTFETLYQHYSVLGSKITARFVPKGSSVLHQGYVGIGLLRDSTTTNDVDTLIERKEAHVKVMGNMAQTAQVSCVNYFSPRKFFGYKDIGDSAETRTAVTANPSDEALFDVFYASLDSGANPEEVHVDVTIEYTVMFCERKDLLQSN